MIVESQTWLNPNLDTYQYIYDLMIRERLHHDQGARLLLARDSKICAIKYVRARTGWGLRESKEYVDKLARKIGFRNNYP